MWTNRLTGYYYDLNLLIHYITMLSDFNHLRVIYYYSFKSKIKFLKFDIITILDLIIIDSLEKFKELWLEWRFILIL